MSHTRSLLAPFGVELSLNFPSQSAPEKTFETELHESQCSKDTRAGVPPHRHRSLRVTKQGASVRVAFVKKTR